MPRWIFVRHGESEANAGRVLSGWNDVALTPLGRSQARRAGRLLAEQLTEVPRVVSSDLQRAHHTAQLAMAAWSTETGQPAPPIVLTPGLRERSMGVLQGESVLACRQDGRMRALLGWESRPQGGESLAQLAARCIDAVDAIDAPGEVVVFAHGGVIRALSGMLDRKTTEQIASRRIKNAKPMIRLVSPGIWATLRERYVLPGG